MAESTCVKCDAKQFEMVEVEPQKSRFKMLFVQCANCGGVVGVTDYHNIGHLIRRLAAKLNINVD